MFVILILRGGKIIFSLFDIFRCLHKMLSSIGFKTILQKMYHYITTELLK
jgi:hypothetical protein